MKKLFVLLLCFIIVSVFTPCVAMAEDEEGVCVSTYAELKKALESPAIEIVRVKANTSKQVFDGTITVSDKKKLVFDEDFELTGGSNGANLIYIREGGELTIGASDGIMSWKAGNASNVCMFACDGKLNVDGGVFLELYKEKSSSGDAVVKAPSVKGSTGNPAEVYIKRGTLFLSTVGSAKESFGSALYLAEGAYFEINGGHFYLQTKDPEAVRNQAAVILDYDQYSSDIGKIVSGNFNGSKVKNVNNGFTFNDLIPSDKEIFYCNELFSPVSTNRPFEVKTAIREKLEIKDIEEPEAGKTPDTTASVSNSNCIVKNLKWYAGKKLFKGSTFKEGVTYTVQVQIKPKKGYGITAPATINGNTAKLVDHFEGDGTVTYSYKFTKEKANAKDNPALVSAFEELEKSLEDPDIDYIRILGNGSGETIDQISPYSAAIEVDGSKHIELAGDFTVIGGAGNNSSLIRAEGKNDCLYIEGKGSLTWDTGSGTDNCLIGVGGNQAGLSLKSGTLKLVTSTANTFDRTVFTVGKLNISGGTIIMETPSADIMNYGRAVDLWAESQFEITDGSFICSLNGGAQQGVSVCIEENKGGVASGKLAGGTYTGICTSDLRTGTLQSFLESGKGLFDGDRELSASAYSTTGTESGTSFSTSGEYVLGPLQIKNTKSKEEEVAKSIEKTTIKAYSTTAKGSITIKWKKSAGYDVDYYEVFRTSKRSGRYGSKPYYKTTDGSKASYKNSRNLKKGTRYYYKVRGVKKADNRIVYTKWSNEVSRIAR